MLSSITLRARIAAAIFLVVGALIGVAFWQVLNTLQTLLQEQVVAQEQLLLDVLRDDAALALQNQAVDGLRHQLAALQRDKHFLRAVLADSAGRVVLDSEQTQPGRRLSELRPAPGAHWRRLALGSAAQRSGTLVLEFSRAQLDEAQEDAFSLGIAIAATGMILITLVGLAIGWLLTRRIDRLRAAAEQMADGNLAVRTGLRGGDEVAALSRAFDLMAQRVAASQYELLRLNRALEHRVQQRTIDLSKSLEEMQRMQDQMVQSEKLAALGSLVAGVSHEINTPLGISVTAATLVEELLKSLEERLRSGGLTRQFLQDFMARSTEANAMALANLQRAAELIRNFKMVAVDQASAKRRQFMLRETVQEIVSTLKPMLKNRRIEVLLDIPDGIAMDSYPGPLGQVITNLFSNALLHAFEGRAEGAIAIKARAYADGTVAVHFSDDGVGIEPEHLNRIFDPFFTTKSGEGGSGLGLSIAYNIVTGVLGGRISAESRLGEGSTFTLTMPLVAPGAPA